MKNFKYTKPFVYLLICLLAISTVSAQKRKPAPPAKPKPIIFAVTSDGASIEPIAVINKGVLETTIGGDAGAQELTDFAGTYYKPKTAYKLIFGGGDGGTVTVKSSNPGGDCGKNIGTVTAVSSKAKLKGLVMALATNQQLIKASGLRRLPTATERSEIEALVRNELNAQGVAAAALKTLHYHNLTAIDVDNDGKAEMVGSYWAETSAKERNQLFFIADKGGDGKYSFGFSDYKKITPEEVMSKEMKDLDDGTYAELLLDTLDYNGDKTDEIFTVTQGFEGSSFNVYARKGGKWVKAFEGSNYHCAY